jgi:hypothetical protein
MPTSAEQRADYYRAKAAECEQKAEEARDLEVKCAFSELARQWKSLAEQAERSDW